MSNQIPYASSGIMLNLRIISVLVFNFASYFTMGLVLGILPGYVHDHLGFNVFWAGVVISVQYIATLITRPTAGRLIDEKGPKRIVLMGLFGLLISAIFYGMAAYLEYTPLIALISLLLARVALGVGQSFIGTGCMLWGAGRVGAIHIGRVISWNGVVTYGAMAVAVPLGVWLMDSSGLMFVAGCIFVLTTMVLGILFIIPDVSIIVGARVPFSVVFKKVWLFGLILSLGSAGFGVIATFITLLFNTYNWNGASYALVLFTVAFIGMRLFFPNTINRYGGLNVAITCFIVEAIGLVLVWISLSPVVTILGAFITGSGFALVFPSLGVVAVEAVSAQSRGSALATYTLFLDLSLGAVGPIAGVLMVYMGISSIYLGAAILCIIGILMILNLKKKISANTVSVQQ